MPNKHAIYNDDGIIPLQKMYVNFGGSLLAVISGGALLVPVGWGAEGSDISSTNARAAVPAGTVKKFSLRCIYNNITDGTVTISLMKNGLEVVAMGPYSTGDTATYSTDLAETVALCDGLQVRVVSSSEVSSMALSVAAVVELELA